MTRHIRLYKVHFQSPKYQNEYEDVTVSARNVIEAIKFASKLTYITARSIQSCAESVELIGVSEN